MRRQLKDKIATIFIAVSATVAVADTVDQESLPRGPLAYRVDRGVFIPMRDSIQLATDLYFPEGEQRQRYPVVLMRTPYENVPGRNFREAAVEVFARHGYVVAIQDKRGKFRTEGVYTASGGDADDGYDTVEWLSEQTWSNGRVGTIGPHHFRMQTTTFFTALGVNGRNHLSSITNVRGSIFR